MNDITEHLRVPPHSDEAEVSVLGGLMLDNTSFDNIIAILNHNDFYKDAHQIIFKAIQEIAERRVPIDQVTVIEQLKQSKKIETVGGAYYVTGLVEATPSAANIEHYAKIVRDSSIRRQLIIFNSEIMNSAYESSENTEELLDRVQNKIISISYNKIQGHFNKIDNYVRQASEHICDLYDKGKIPGISTGLIDIDKITGGLQRGLQYILAGRPSQGKSALAMTIADNIATYEKLPVGIISLEMSGKALVLRLIAKKARINHAIFNRGKFEEGTFHLLMSYIQPISELPIYIDDSTDYRINDIIAKTRLLKKKEDIQLLIVDHLQLTGNEDNRFRGNKNLEIGEITKQLRNEAKNLNISTLVLSQLSRLAEHKRPTLAHLRDSGEIEQNADVVMFIWRPETAGINNDKEGNSNKNIANIYIDKHRDGATGEFKLTFNPEQVAFYNYSDEKEIPF